jgi:hypothetical protein
MTVDPEFLRQVDNAIRSDLQSWRGLYFHLLVWSSVFVAVGVALEGPEVIHEVRNISRTAREEARSWIKLIGLLGWILVVAGVAGEGLFEGMLSASDGQIQTFDEILTMDAQRSALLVEASNLRLGIELAEQEQETADAEKSAAEANAKLGGWKLDDAAKKQFAEYVKKFPGTPFDLAINPVEAPFMESLDALLTSPSVGWVRLPPKPDNSLMAILIDGKASIILSSGIVLEVDRDQAASLQPAVIALGTALHKELQLSKVVLHLVPPGSWGNRIHIIIGKRE